MSGGPSLHRLMRYAQVILRLKSGVTACIDSLTASVEGGEPLWSFVLAVGDVKLNSPSTNGYQFGYPTMAHARVAGLVPADAEPDDRRG
jgi:hypothetical protein